MTQQSVIVNSFNRGLISAKGLARTDLDRLPLSAAVQNNCMPRVLGPMSLRCGKEYIGASLNNSLAYHLPFIFSNTDTASLEMTDLAMRVRIDDDLIERPSVSTAVLTPDFSSDTNWTDGDEGSAVSTISGGELSLVGTRYDAAIRHQAVTVSGGDSGVEHGINVVVTQGPVIIKIGSTQGDDDYFTEAELGTGTHSLSITPTGNFFIELSGRTEYATSVTSCSVEAEGAMEVTTPWAEAVLSLIRWSQSADVTYTATDGVAEKKIVRWGTRSWGVVDYAPLDGPFLAPNTSTTRLTPSAISGDITLTSDRDYFTSGNVGSLFRMTSVGQQVEIDVTAEAQWSDPIRVSGVGSSQRGFTVARAGTWVATASLQRSVGEVGSWIDVTTYTTNGSGTYNDGLDNQIAYYRIGVDTGDFTSGTVELSLDYASGGITGICKVTGFTSSTSVSAAVVKNLGGTDSTEIWDEGAWSTRRGHSSAVTLHEGRSWWGGKGKVRGSVSDAFESFDDEVEGDSGPITKTIGGGTVDTVNWLLSSTRLFIGTDSAEFILRSSTLDEPLTATNASMKAPSTQGSAPVPPVLIDTTGMFVQKSQERVFDIDFKVEKDDFQSDDASKLIPEFLAPKVARMAVQRQPDTRVHCVLKDGTAMVLIYDDLENVKCWVSMTTDGLYEDVHVLPDTSEDRVYYSIKRTINSATVRYLEKTSLESECVGGTLNKQADSFYHYSGSATATITGLDHLEGEEVVVWADGVDLSPHTDDQDWTQTTYTVTSGQIVLATTVSEAIIGLPYTGQWKSTKLAYGAEGVSMGQQKRIGRIGFVLQNAHIHGLRFGQDFTDMDQLPHIEDGEEGAETLIYETYDQPSIDFDGYTSPDPRACLEMYAPRPCTVMALIIGLSTSEKT